MFTAALKFIESMCGCGIPVISASGSVVGGEECGCVLDVWQAVVEDNLAHTEATLRVSHSP